jgi:hypothetical protein
MRRSNWIISGRERKANIASPIAVRRSRMVPCGHGIEREMPAHLLAFALDRRGEQRPLVAELVVDRDLGNARIGCDLLDRGGGIAMVEEVVRRRIDDRLPLGRIKRPPRLAGLYARRWVFFRY